MSPQSPFLKRFIAAEQSAGLLLLAATLAALLWANLPDSAYGRFWELPLSFGLEAEAHSMTLKHFVDDVLMSLFFLLVGCELKRERLEGELAQPAQIKLPLFAALGGMIAPALFYTAAHVLLPAGTVPTLHGWAVPTATDIAFALGVLVMVKNCVPPSLKPFLLALAIIDDLGAVVLIGLFYSSGIHAGALAFVALLAGLLYLLNRFNVRALTPYLLLGVPLWIAVYQTGIHATLAGVLLACFIPMRTAKGESPLKKLESSLHGWVVYLIMPVFALANAGVPLGGVQMTDLLHPMPMGILCGLFLGKQVGVFGASWLCIHLGWAEKPARARWRHLYGVSLLCGIGFTMSLFIAALAFSDASSLALARLSILGGSVLSAAGGAAILIWAKPRAIPRV